MGHHVGENCFLLCRLMAMMNLIEAEIELVSWLNDVVSDSGIRKYTIFSVLDVYIIFSENNMFDIQRPPRPLRNYAKLLHGLLLV